MRTAVRFLIKNIIDKHFETYEEGATRDFIDIYISQIKQSEPGSSFHSEEGSKREGLNIFLHPSVSFRNDNDSM
jgi:hypothetical protein